MLLIACTLSLFVMCEGAGNETFSVFMEICMGDKQMMIEEEVKVCQSNYTLMAPAAHSDSLVLTICVRSEDPGIAMAHLSQSETFDLHTAQSAKFNMSLKGSFVGRTYIDVTYVFSKISIQNLCEGKAEVEKSTVFTQPGKNFNLTSAYPSSDSEAVFVSRHELVVIREERVIDTAFQVIVILLVVIVNLGLGCKTELSVVKETLRRPIAPITGFCSQFIIMPLVRNTCRHLLLFIVIKFAMFPGHDTYIYIIHDT